MSWTLSLLIKHPPLILFLLSILFMSEMENFVVVTVCLLGHTWWCSGSLLVMLGASYQIYVDPM